MSVTEDEKLMLRCIELAKRGLGKVSPNPMVGCVIVRNGKIIAEGYHKQYGGPHAEIYALLNAGKKAKGATLYVNLEPCVHFGKTPPCVDAIIKAGISKVVIGTNDPNPLVNGSGEKILRANGIDVKSGVLESEAKKINDKFLKFMKTNLPFVSIKLAQTIDGRIADIDCRSKWITSKLSRKYVHKLRSQYDSIMIGANTVKSDNPTLTVRLIKGRNPLRIVVDGSLSLKSSYKIFDTTVAPTWLLTSSKVMKLRSSTVNKFTSQGVRVIGINGPTQLEPSSILKKLGEEGITSVFIEGGASLVSNFMGRELFDRLYIIVSPKIFGGGLSSFILRKPKLLDNAIKLSIERVFQIDKDLYIELIINNKRKK